MLRELNFYTDQAKMLEMPKRFQAQWKTFLKVANDVLSRPLFDTAKMTSLMSELRFCEELQSTIHSQSKVMEENEALNIISKFMKWALFEDCVPWENNAYDLRPNVPIMGEYSAVMGLTVLCAGMIGTIEQARARKIPEKYLTHIKRCFHRSIMAYYKANRSWGINEFGWNIMVSSFVLYKIGKYSFNLEHFNIDAVVYRNKKTSEVKALSLPDYEFNFLGERVSNEKAKDIGVGSFVSTFNETDEYVEGTYLLPIGFAVNETVTLDKAEWEKKVYPGCVTISFHIPTAIDYTPESIKIDFKKAMRFYKKYFPEMDFSAFYCNSWLFSPQLQILFDERESKVVRIQRETYMVASMHDDSFFKQFVFKGEELDPKTASRDTRLKRSILEFIEKGGTVGGGKMVLLNEDVNRIGEQPYYKKEDFLKIKKLYEQKGLL